MQPQAPLRNSVQYKHGLTMQEAILEWTGDTVRLQLEPSGDVIFDVVPTEIQKLRTSQGAFMTFTIGGQKYRIYYTAQARALMGLDMVPGPDGKLTGAAIEGRKAMIAASPVQRWATTMRSLGVQVVGRFHL
jgi:hypothetical protein